MSAFPGKSNGYGNTATGREPADPTGSQLAEARARGVFGGRPVGSKTSEARSFALEIVRSPEYRTSLLERVKAGTLPPNIEAMLWAYAYGKPAEHVKIEHLTPQHALETMTADELAAKAELVAKVLREVGDIDAAALAMKLTDQADHDRRDAAIEGQLVPQPAGKSEAA